MAKTEKVDKDNSQQNKLEALEIAMAKIEKSHGKGAIMNMADDKIENVSVIPTGSLGIDIALGIGGLPRGRIIEIYGQESSGKTTLAIHAIAQAQKMGGLAAIVDAEHAFDPFYAQKLGVDIKKLWISQPDNGEQALDIAEQLIRSSAVDIVVIDSVAALTPKQEIDGEMGEATVGLHARLMSRALRKLTGAISKSNTVCIFINQLREKIGSVGYGGNNEVTTGGNALKFYSSIRIDIRKGAKQKITVKGEEIITGNTTYVKIAKNKLAPPFRKAVFDMIYGEGISREGEVIDYGVKLGIIKKSGSWFSYDTVKLGQGRDKVRELLKDNVELTAELTQKIFDKIRAEGSSIIQNMEDDDLDDVAFDED